MRTKIDDREQKIYDDLWATVYIPSQCAKPFAAYADSLMSVLMHKEILAGSPVRVLDIGCGNGVTVQGLLARGYYAEGVDLSEKAIEQVRPEYDNAFSIASVTELDRYFDANRFDATVSTDFLEHLPPEIVDEAIRNIVHVTRSISIHVVATFADERDGEVLHKSPLPAEEWCRKIRDAFDEAGKIGVEVYVLDRKDFLTRCRKPVENHVAAQL